MLVVEDDEKIASLVKQGLEDEGYTVDVASTGHDGLWLATEGTYDLLVLDIMLPGRSGFQICADLREQGNTTPILMLTAKDGDLDEAEGLDTGADDYLVKPFSFPVLLARTRALLRRAAGARRAARSRKWSDSEAAARSALWNLLTRAKLSSDKPSSGAASNAPPASASGNE